MQRIYFEKCFYKLFTLVSDIGLYILKLSLFDFIEKIILVFGPEGIVALQHDIIKYTQRPHISINRTMIHLGYNLRRHISRRSTKRINGLVLGTSQAKSKINQFDLLVTIDQNVFGFDVPMDNAQIVQILQGLSYHENEFLRLELLHAMLWL